MKKIPLMVSTGWLLGALLSLARADVMAHWSFDETATDSAPGGADFADSSGNGRHASINSEVKVSASGSGVFGSGVDLDGTAGGYITTPYVPGIHTSGFTMAAWIKPADNGINTIFSDWRSTWSFWMRHRNGQLGMHLRRSGSPVDIINVEVGSISIGAYHHVALAWDRIGPTDGTMRFYIDGVPASSNAASGGGTLTVDVIHNVRDYHIGWKQDSADTFNGSIDELWIFDETLAPEQILNLRDYNDVAGPSPSGTLLVVR